MPQHVVLGVSAPVHELHDLARPPPMDHLETLASGVWNFDETLTGPAYPWLKQPDNTEDGLDLFFHVSTCVIPTDQLQRGARDQFMHIAIGDIGPFS